MGTKGFKAKFVFKGGAGSGFHGHSGRPGKIGGSASEGTAQSTYDRKTWTALDVPTRIGNWKAMSITDRDAAANARSSIKDRVNMVLSYVGNVERPALEGNGVASAISKRCKQLSTLTTAKNMVMIRDTVDDYDSLLEASGLSEEQRYKLTQDAIDILAVQDNESLGRQLGDHGIHHIRGNIDFALEMAQAHPAGDSPEDLAKIFVANIYHDAGYLAPPSHDFMDEGHPRWSMQHYDANVRPMIEEMFGSDFAGDVSHIIRTHDATNIDWDSDLYGSAVRVADNTALFQDQKLPPIFREVPGNLDVLMSLQAKDISVEDAKRSMNANIDKVPGLSDAVRSELHRGVNEVNQMTSKFTLGMLGGKVQKFEWTGDHMKVHVAADKQSTIWQKFLDLGQRQFGKFAESYGYDPDKFKSDLSFQFKDPNGNMLLEAVIEG